jgi:hypothetical protein
VTEGIRGRKGSSGKESKAAFKKKDYKLKAEYLSAF